MGNIIYIEPDAGGLSVLEVLKDFHVQWFEYDTTGTFLIVRPEDEEEILKLLRDTYKSENVKVMDTRSVFGDFTTFQSIADALSNIQDDIKSVKRISQQEIRVVFWKE